MKSFASYQHELRARRRRRFLARTVLVGIGCIAVFGVILYVLFFARWFDVRYVEVYSPGAVQPSEIKREANKWLDKKWFGIAHRRNSILFPPSRLVSVIRDKFPRVGDVLARRDSIHAIKLTITDRKAVGIWCIMRQNICFYFDENGTAFAELPPTSGFLFIAVNDHRDRTIKLGDEVAPIEWRRDIVAVKRILQFGALPVSEFSIASGSFDQFETKTKEDWKIIFSTQTDVNQQATNLLAFLKEKITKAERQKLEYVNLTIPNRIYYK